MEACIGHCGLGGREPGRVKDGRPLHDVYKRALLLTFSLGPVLWAVSVLDRSAARGSMHAERCICHAACIQQSTIAGLNKFEFPLLHFLQAYRASVYPKDATRLWAACAVGALVLPAAAKLRV